MRTDRPRRAAAILLIGSIGGIALAFVVARGSLGGADALAYWTSTRVWLAGGDPFHPPGIGWAYVYAPWMLPLFLPWALLPWPAAQLLWRGAMFLCFLWSCDWAYRRRPLATALALLVLGAPIGLILESGNVTVFLALALWAAQVAPARAGGALWAWATATKWFPAAFWFILPSATRRRGLAWIGLAILLTLATWPQALTQVGAALVWGVPRTDLSWWIRLDHLAVLWGGIPWLWRHPLTLPRPRQAPDRHERLRAPAGLAR
ncbi:MAG: hypothetical protein A2X23_04470 [Chloroflexi bacterium GWC2_73_18]|nr:MAG: hypothetical protein A2X23_04470 [Chloroflexi bacterium GWC2_73_18]